MSSNNQEVSYTQSWHKMGQILIQCAVVLLLLGMILINFPTYHQFSNWWVVLVFITTIANIYLVHSDIQASDVILLGVFGALALYAHFISQKGAMNLFAALSFGLLGITISLISRHYSWPRWLLIALGYLALAPFLYGFFVKGINLSRGGDFFGMNRNTIPRLLFMTTSLVLIIQYSQGQRLDLLLAALTVLVTFRSRSRAGLLISSGLFVMTLAQEYLRIKVLAWVRIHRKLVTIFLIVAVIVLVLIGMYLIENSRLKTEGLSSSGRTQIHLKFLRGLNLKKIVFGSRPAILDGIGLHSSYLTWYAMFGIFSVVPFAALFMTGHRLSSHSLYLFGVLLLWITYSLVETLSPFFEGDVILLILIHLNFMKRNFSATQLNLKRLMQNLILDFQL